MGHHLAARALRKADALKATVAVGVDALAVGARKIAAAKPNRRPAPIARRIRKKHHGGF